MPIGVGVSVRSSRTTILDTAETAGGFRVALRAVREARGMMKLLGRITCQLVSKAEHSGLSGPQITVTEVVIFKDYGQLREGRNIIDVVDGEVVSE